VETKFALLQYQNVKLIQVATNGPSTRRRALKLQRFCPVTLNGLTLRFAELHFALLASKVEQCSTFEASTEASANQIICQYKL